MAVLDEGLIDGYDLQRPIFAQRIFMILGYRAGQGAARIKCRIEVFKGFHFALVILLPILL